MALKKIVFAPGINRDRTNYSSTGGWYSGDKIRFRQGYPEKIGGWTTVNFTPYIGDASSLISYGTTDESSIVGVGTNQKIYVLVGTNLYDTTPIRATFTSPDTDNCFATTDTSTTLVVTIAGHGGSDGDRVTFSGAVDVGGVPAGELNTEHVISNVTGTTFEITVTTAATSTVATGGGTAITAVFQISIGYAGTTFGYGWGAGTWSRGTWGSAAGEPVAFPARVIYQNQFNNDIIYNLQAGNIYYWEYDLAISNRGVPLNTLVNSRAVPQLVNRTIFAPSGHLLALACTEYSETYTAGQTISTITRSGTTATVTTATGHGLEPYDWVVFSGQAPQVYQGEYQVVTVPTTTTFTMALPYDPGSDATIEGTYQKVNYDDGAYDPLLIRWANVDPNSGPQPEEWKPEITNNAGFLRVKQGSAIISAIRTRQEVLIFTEIALTTLQFLGTDEVFGSQEISSAINLMGPNVIAEVNNVVYWMGNDKFFMYDGRVNTLPCTLKQYVFEDINRTQGFLFTAGVNSEFNEVIWFYASASSNTINRYVIYNFLEQIWYYGTLSRTTWVDSGTIKFPLSTYDGYVYQHEDGKDNGQPAGESPLPIESFIQSADMTIEDGDNFILTKRVIPDVNFNNSEIVNPVTGAPLVPEVQMTVGVRNFPGATNNQTDVEGLTLTRDVITTATINTYTNQVFVRARGRQMNFKIASDTLGVQWELGSTRIDFKPDGRRGGVF